MKVYNWKALLFTIIFIVYTVIAGFKNLFDGSFAFIKIILWLGLVIQGFLVSFSYEKNMENEYRAECYKKVQRKLFGPFAPVLYHLGYVLILLAGCLTYVSYDWAYSIFIVGIIYQLIVTLVVRWAYKRALRKSV